MSFIWSLIYTKILLTNRILVMIGKKNQLCRHFDIIFIALFSMQLVFVPKLWAEVVLDGSMGTRGNISGPHYQIPESAGKLAGNNLFHSFSQFNIATGESATFTGQASIQNVISRVTGGNLSTINGLIDGSAMPDANFFLINPAGIVFGADASLDIGGSFTATTANYLQFSDGAQFFAQPLANEILSVAPIDAFGFTSSSLGAIQINGSQLEVSIGKNLSLVGGDINIDSNALIRAEDGLINLISLGSTGRASTNVNTTIGTDSFGALGALSIQNSELDVSGNSGGLIWMRSGTLNLNNVKIHANSTGIGNALGVNIDVKGTIQILNGSFITSDADAEGNAGSILVKAGNQLDINGGEISSDAFSEGNAGNVWVEASNQLNLINDGKISSDAYGIGNAGSVSVQSGSLAIDGSLISSDAYGIGDAGSVLIKVNNQLNVVNGGKISSNAQGLGSGGLIYVGVSSLTMHGSFISSDAYGTGDAGGILIKASSQLDMNRGEISSDAYGMGSAGLISIEVDSLTMYGSFVSSDTYAAGNAGNVEVKVNNQLDVTGGKISSTTFSTGNAGGVSVSAYNIYLINTAKISSLSAINATGSAGNLSISARGNVLVDNASIDISTITGYQSDNRLPGIDLRAVNLILQNNAQITTQAGVDVAAGDISIETTKTIQLFSGSKINTSADLGDGGDIHLKTKDYIYLNNSQIKTSVSTTEGNARGGDIWIDPIFVTLNDSQILAETFNGQGGNITIITDYFMKSGNSLISAAANGALGVSGTIDLYGPNVEQAAGVDQLPINLLKADQWAAQACSKKAGNLSSFVMQQVLPMDYGNLLASPLLSLSYGTKIDNLSIMLTEHTYRPYACYL